MKKHELLNWLRETDSQRLEQLWSTADEVRRQNVGDEVYLRGLLEISNYCARQCHYCGIRAANHELHRYRMSLAEILERVDEIVQQGFGTVVMQAGEDPGITCEFMQTVITQIKQRTSLAVTLSLGQRSEEELAVWREAGADRFLLRFETSNRELFDRIHPPFGEVPNDRLALLRSLKALGYEVGSGVMIGIPGQSFDDLADDILLFGELDLDMIGVGPYIPHPDTPLAQALSTIADQVPNDELTTYKVVALTRIIRPKANIPATTALATINPTSGRQNALCRGANIMMPNLTPQHHRTAYQIYPNKVSLSASNGPHRESLAEQLASIGRTIGKGRGDSPNLQSRQLHNASADQQGVV